MRSLGFRQRAHNRYWWHRVPSTDYVPMLYEFLDEDEWSLLQQWFDDTEQRYPSTGEAGVPALSLLLGLISGNGISRIVQLGHYVGYSTLMIGFMARHMNKRRMLYSVDIDPAVSAYARGWVERAGLGAEVHLEIGDSADPDRPKQAAGYLGGAPQLIFIDSSHQYAHTLRELDLWFPALVAGGFLLMHDSSDFARGFDKAGGQGVKQALEEWIGANRVAALNVNGFVGGGRPGDYPYLDGCGLTIIQKSPA
ncbi:MAG: class I SAM-dependent methyltransferase [Rhodocyclaceae bacterium]|nr:class I SAM-dependent methyltransferase [Rhodocyclaceae bacterium]